jgi:hypothetical protein
VARINAQDETLDSVVTGLDGLRGSDKNVSFSPLRNCCVFIEMRRIKDA